MKVAAVVPAAGIGRRYANRRGKRKPFLIVRNKPVLIHTLYALEKSGRIDDIIAVVHNDDVAEWRALIKKSGLKKVKSVIAGGRTRFESVKKGLRFVGSADTILIHDGVRPLVDKKMITNSIKACRRFGAAVCGLPVTSTIKSVNGRSYIKMTPERRSLYTIQTPQVFRKDIILKAYSKAGRGSRSITDDSMLVERLGYKVKVVPGSYRNIKITTPEDLILAEILIDEVALSGCAAR